MDEKLIHYFREFGEAENIRLFDGPRPRWEGTVKMDLIEYSVVLSTGYIGRLL
jgi:hypothetical protein